MKYVLYGVTSFFMKLLLLNKKGFILQ